MDYGYSRRLHAVSTGEFFRKAKPALTRSASHKSIAADTDVLTPPCGACRQILWEFCGDIELILVNLNGKTETLRMKDLFPRPFDASFI